MAVTIHNTRGSVENTESGYPRQDIPESKKTFAWCMQHIDYAVDHYRGQVSRNRRRMQRNYSSYNGVVDNMRVKYLLYTYRNKRNIGNFVDYRLGRTKIDLLVGEWIKTPLNAVVSVTNRDAKTKKLDLVNVRRGLMETANEVDKLRNVIGVDIFNGMEIPSSEKEINTKTRNEILMQHAIDYQIKRQELRSKFADNFKDVCIVSECHCKIDITNEGKVEVEDIDPRDYIYIEGLRDPFNRRSPYKGYRKQMFYTEIIAAYDLTLEQRESLYQQIQEYGDSDGNSKSDYGNSDSYLHHTSGNLSIDVYHIEWTSVREINTKVIIDKKGNERRKDFSTDFFNKNKSKIKRQAEKGKFKLEKTWKEELWEGVRIGQDIYVKKMCRPVPFQIQVRDNMNKYRAQSNFESLLFNTVDGTRVSMVEILDNISFLYNVVMFQINRELAKLKGKVVEYDLAFLPKGKKIEDIMYNILNDGIFFTNSKQSGNRSRQDGGKSPIREIDLGVSQAFQQLVNIKITLEATADKLSGVNENREGQIAASATATGTTQAIAASRNITTGMFFFFNRYVENVLSKVAEKTKLAWVFKNSEEGEFVIGDEGMQFFKVTKDFANDDYTTFVTDGQKEREAREKVDLVASAAVNAKELRVEDYLEYLLADTTGEALSTIKQSWADLRKVQQEDQELQINAEQKKLQTTLEIAREDREDKQAHEIEVEMIRAGLNSEAKTQEAKNQAVNEQLKLELGGEQPQEASPV